MTPENAASPVAQPAGLTPENAELLARYAGYLQRLPRARTTSSSRIGPVS